MLTLVDYSTDGRRERGLTWHCVVVGRVRSRAATQAHTRAMGAASMTARMVLSPTEQPKMRTGSVTERRESIGSDTHCHRSRGRHSVPE